MLHNRGSKGKGDQAGISRDTKNQKTPPRTEGGREGESQSKTTGIRGGGLRVCDRLHWGCFSTWASRSRRKEALNYPQLQSPGRKTSRCQIPPGPLREKEKSMGAFEGRTF